MKKKVLFILILLSLLIAQAYAQGAKGTVAPFYTFQNTTPQQYMDTSGADKSVSFWDLPLWIIIACFVSTLLAVLLAIKTLPIIIGILSNQSRSTNSLAIEEYIINNPGVTISQISRDTEINRNTVKFYILDFIRSGKIVLEHFGKFTKIFYKDTDYNETEKAVISLLGNGKAREILQGIIDNQGMTGAELARMFQMERSSMHWYLERLLENKLVIFTQEGVHKKYFINPEMKALISKYNKY